MLLYVYYIKFNTLYIATNDRNVSIGAICSYSVFCVVSMQSLQLESCVLKESLSEFSWWTRHKLQLLEEDMDIFKVIYSLHGSLSQVCVFGGGRKYV